MLPGVDGNIEELLEKSRLYRSRRRIQYVKAGDCDWLAGALARFEAFPIAAFLLLLG